MVRQIVEFRDKKETSVIWARKNPILGEGERGFETDTGFFKIGNGVTRWLDLPYFKPAGQGGGDTQGLTEHINSENPHPVYDDGTSFLLRYENAKV